MTDAGVTLRACLHCRGPIPASKKTSVQFCNRQCWKDHKAELAGGHVSCTCERCSKTFTLTANRVKSGAGKFCSNTCRAESKARPEVPCPICGKVFVSKVVVGGRRQIYCSKTCGGAGRQTRVTRQCRYCGKLFSVAMNKVLEGKGHFCSVACARPGPTRMACEKCGKEFDAWPSELARGWGRFCSNECRRTRVERTCVVCGDGFESTPFRVANEGGKYCSVKCRGLARQNRVIKTCPVCETDFPTPASVKWTCCSRECATQLRRDDPVEVERVRKMQHNQMMSKAPNKPERALYRYMDDVFGPKEWVPQAYILNKWTVDAWVPKLNLVVQADGDWWHGWLEKSRTNPVVQANMGRDQGQNSYLDKVGWRSLRLWEHELLRDPDGCVNRLTAMRDELSAPV